jgi:hypothetical protein
VDYNGCWATRVSRDGSCDAHAASSGGCSSSDVGSDCLVLSCCCVCVYFLDSM